MLNANKAYRRVPPGPDTASRLHPYSNPRHQSAGRGVSPLNRPESKSRDCYPHPPRAKTKWYAPQYKDKSYALRGVSPLNRPDRSRDYDPHPDRSRDYDPRPDRSRKYDPRLDRSRDYGPSPTVAKTRWYSPQYKDSTKNRYRRYSKDNSQQFNNVSPLKRPDNTQTPHPRLNSKPGKVSCEVKTGSVNSASPTLDLPLSKTQGEITRVLKVEKGDFLHYRSWSSDDEGYTSAGNDEDLPPPLQPPVHTSKSKRRRRRDRRIVEVHLLTSLARLTLKSRSELELAVAAAQDTGDRRRVIFADPEKEVDLVLPRKRKRGDLLLTVPDKQQKLDADSVNDVFLQTSPKDASSKNDVAPSTSETDIIEAIDLCLQSMAKVKDTPASTTTQKDAAVNVRIRRWRRKGQKSSNNAESRRHISRVDEDPLDLSC